MAAAVQGAEPHLRFRFLDGVSASIEDCQDRRAFIGPLRPRWLRMSMGLLRYLGTYVRVAKKYWTEAFKTTAYLRNRIKIEGMHYGMSPYEATMGQQPDLDFMRIFGCNCFAHVPK
jgi:hypothetical protein